jgi:N-acetylated-alpha-linked acidic dipeptidase
LPITYHLGPGRATVHLRLEFNWDIVTIYDVIARLPGSEKPDEWIIRGNHHDAWVCGADDPLSGTVALMEEARVLGELRANGWRPKRTLVFALWDGEEPGLLGSTEWVETHADLLTNQAAVYVNSDNNGRGFLQVGGSHTLEKFMNQVACDVTDPEKKISVGARLRAYHLVKGSAEEKADARDREEFRMGALGSGSDYTPFLQHLGVASLDIRYGGEDQGGAYHSIYDSYDHYQRFGDPGFAYGMAQAQTTGRVLLRLLNCEVLPFDFSDFAETLRRYIKEVEKLADEQREKSREKERWLKDQILAAVSDPTQTYILPKPDSPVPFLNFAPLENALVRLQDGARAYSLALNKSRLGDRWLSADTERDLDVVLFQTERTLTAEAGLPRRPWYKHQVYAPGFYTGYGVKTLPGVREAIEGRRWTEANEQIESAARSIERAAAQVERAASLVGLQN